MNRWTTLALIVLVAALAVFFFQKKRTPPPSTTPVLLSHFQPEAVREIFFENLDRGVRATFRRVPGGWVMTQPFVYPAESSAVEAMLAPLSNNSCTLVADLKLRPDLSLEAYGLTKPHAVIRINEGGRDRELRVGAETLSGDQVFVISEERLLQTSRNILNATQRNLEELRAKEAFRIPFDAVREFEVWRGADSMRFRLENGLWRLDHPWKEEADSPQVSSLLAALVSIRVEKFFEDHPGADAAYGLDAPMYRVVLRDGQREDELRIGRSPGGELLARRMDFSYVWSVKEEIERFFQQAPSEFRNRTFFRAFRDQISEIRLQTSAGETVFVRRDGAWRLGAPREWRVDRRAVEDLLDQLQRLQVSDFAELGSRTLAELGLDPASSSVQVKAEREAPVRVLFGQREGAGKRYARRDGSDSALLVDESAVLFLGTSMLDYLDPVLITFSEDSLKRLELVEHETDAEKKAAWIRGGDGIWRRLGADGKPSEGEDRKLSSVLDHILFWKGKKALQEIPAEGFQGAPWIELRYFQTSAEEGATPDFIATIWKSQTGVPITRGKDPVAWEVDSKLVEVLLGLF